MTDSSTSLHEFAREAEQQYRRLAELAESAGVISAAAALRQKAARMQALLDHDMAPEESPGPLSEVHLVLSQLHSHLTLILKRWPPENGLALVEAVNEVLTAADRLSRLGQTQTDQLPPRRRRRWTAQDPPPTLEPPTFPGPRKSKK